MKPKIPEEKELSRRAFLKCTGTIVFAMGTSGYVLGECGAKETGSGIAVSDGYLVVDVEKCQGCISCMLACALVHEGVQSLSLSRIQILQNSFGKFPDDLTIEQCRQCEEPACVEACPENALTANAQFGHVRMVDKEKCTGCGSCFTACPHTPARVTVMEDETFNRELKSLKCDLCAHTPYHWDEKGGGPDGKLACVEVCPVGAIAFTRKLPVQEGKSGYKINLRDDSWVKLGYRKS
ncbi:MAG: 4Fe-4S dicluster domain-containing protein [Desulfotignum sp.]|nr:4Fe-4S dicluster domain-containing protein [Desulfotignum sp.]